MSKTLTLRQADDWHLHLRDGKALSAVVPYTARQFARAIIMPNLQPPVVSIAQAESYHQRIMQALPADSSFQALMTLYLTDSTSPELVHEAAAHPHIYAFKLYPAGATTNSDSGVTDMRRIEAALTAMEATGLPLLVHGEVTDPSIDVFDREAVFIEQRLLPVLDKFPSLRVVFEHITTQQAAEFVLASPENIAATVTPQHLLYNRNSLFVGGIRPHYYCLPVLKREQHRQVLVEAVTGDSKKFFLGTDSAPHAQHRKEAACGCAGIFSAASALELYAEVFDQANALDRLEAFASLNGPAFYGLPVNEQTITLEQQDWTMDASIDFPDSPLIPLRAGETIHWKIRTARI